MLDRPPAEFKPPNLDIWPKTLWKPKSEALRVNVDDLKKSDITKWKIGQTLLLSGKILTARDAAHKKIQDLISRGKLVKRII